MMSCQYATCRSISGVVSVACPRRFTRIISYSLCAIAEHQRRLNLRYDSSSSFLGTSEFDNDTKNNVKKNPVASKVPSPTWRTFLRNHLPDIATIEMFVVATTTFRLLYALIVLSLDRRRVVHFAVTPNPTQDWLSRQMTEAFPWTPHLAICCGTGTNPTVRHSAIAFARWGSRKSSPRRDSPWQNPYAERLIGSIRRDCLDHVILQRRPLAPRPIELTTLERIWG